MLSSGGGRRGRPSPGQHPIPYRVAFTVDRLHPAASLRPPPRHLNPYQRPTRVPTLDRTRAAHCLDGSGSENCFLRSARLDSDVQAEQIVSLSDRGSAATGWVAAVSDLHFQTNLPQSPAEAATSAIGSTLPALSDGGTAFPHVGGRVLVEPNDDRLAPRPLAKKSRHRESPSGISRRAHRNWSVKSERSTTLTGPIRWPLCRLAEEWP